jgi:hypothetical protein
MAEEKNTKKTSARKTPEIPEQKSSAEILKDRKNWDQLGKDYSGLY